MSDAHVNRKWTCYTLEPWFWTNFLANRLYKSKKLSNTNLIASRYFKKEKCPLPVDVRRSKTSLLKLPFDWWQEELKRLPMMLCFQLYYYLTFITWSFTFTPMAAVQLCWERELSDHSMFLNWYIFAISTCKQRNILQSLVFLVRGSPYARLSQFSERIGYSTSLLCSLERRSGNGNSLICKAKALFSWMSNRPAFLRKLWFT